MPLTNNDDLRVPFFQDKPGCVEGNVKIFPWDSGEICWDNNPFCWDDVAITIAEEIVEVVKAGGGFVQGYEKLDKPKKKKFIAMVAKVKGEETLRKQIKEVKEVNLSVEDIKLTVESILRITIDVEK